MKKGHWGKNSVISKAILTPQQLRKCHILENMKLYLIRQLFQRTHILCCNYKPFLWCGVAKACVTVIWKLLKRCLSLWVLTQTIQSVGTNLALILPSLVVGYISHCLLTLKLRGWWSKNLLSMLTPCFCSPDDDYKQEWQGGSSTTSLSRGGCSWSSLGHLLSIPRLYW